MRNADEIAQVVVLTSAEIEHTEPLRTKSLDCPLPVQPLSQAIPGGPWRRQLYCSRRNVIARQSSAISKTHYNCLYLADLGGTRLADATAHLDRKLNRLRSARHVSQAVHDRVEMCGGIRQAGATQSAR